MRSTARNFWFDFKGRPSLSHSAYPKHLLSAALVIFSINALGTRAYPSVDHRIALQRVSQSSSDHVWQDLSLRYFNTPLELRKHGSVQTSLSEIFKSFHSEIDILQRVKWLDTSIELELSRLSADLVELEKWSKGWSPMRVSQTYANALALDAELLSTAQKTEPASTLKTIHEVRVGVELKLKFAKASKGPSPALIELVVSTFRRSVEVGDYEVWYVPRGWADAGDKYRRFDDLSSPSIKELSPGNYLIWLQRDGTVVSDRTPITLGDDGKSKRRVQLTVSR